jgi:hypothetical protein
MDETDSARMLAAESPVGYVGNEPTMSVVMTGSASDPVEKQQHIHSKRGREELAERFKKPDDPLRRVIVRDMWLTGFDQSTLAVIDLFFLSVPMAGSLFYEDVTAWLDQHDVRYTPNVKFTGTSGFDHLFEFVIPRSRQQPERILQTINRPSRDTAELNRGRMRSSMTRNTPFPQAFWMLCINTTTTRFTESTIDEAILEWADGLAYTVLYGPEFAPDEPHVEGKSLGEVLLMGAAAGEDRYRRGCKGHLTVRAPLARNAPKGGLISEGDPVVSAAHFGKDLIDSGSRRLQSIAAVAQQHLDLIAAVLLHGDPIAAFRTRDCQSSVGERCV